MPSRDDSVELRIRKRKTSLEPSVDFPELKGKHSELKGAYSSVLDFTSLSSESILLIFRDSSQSLRHSRSGWSERGALGDRGAVFSTLGAPWTGFPHRLWVHLSVLVCV